MVVAAEALQIQTPWDWDVRQLTASPESCSQVTEGAAVYPVASVEYETFTQARFRRWLGGIALQPTVAEANSIASSEAQPDSMNLLMALHEANAGSEEALAMICANATPAVSEACFKKDHVTKVTTRRNAQGELLQFNQTMRSVYRNALMRTGRPVKLEAITEAEALNGHRIEDALRAGELKDYYFVVSSIVPGDVPEKYLGSDGDGYFLEDLTFVVQATTETQNGDVTTESAFMAGVDADGVDDLDDFAIRCQKRFDITVLQKIYQRFGIDAPETARGFLENGLYIPKSLMPNGVVDVMRWCDEAKAEIMGQANTRHPEDYVNIIEQSKRREASLAETQQKVVQDLLAEADTFDEPMQAVRRMWQIIKKHTVDAAMQNTQIDPRVFGGEAAGYIRQIRAELQNGAANDMAKDLVMRELRQKAQTTSTISGCGGGASSNKEETKADPGKEKKLKCVTCPLCERQGVDATITYEVGKKTIKCSKCNRSKTYAL